MEDIVRRLRSMKQKNGDSLKESLLEKKLNEVGEEDEDPTDLEGETDVEEDPLEDNEEDEFGPESEYDSETPSSPQRSTARVGDFEGDEETITPDDAEEFNQEEEDININPLDNQFAVNFKIGDEVSMTYANGTASKLSGVIEGYDPEGFYRVRWANGLTTNGITDIALSEFVSSATPDEEESCICGSEDFVTEGKNLVCDSCGRKINKKSKDNRLIRSEVHPMSTSAKPSISERIKNAFKGVRLKEADYEDDEDVYARLKDKLSGVFWSRFNEMIDAVERLGYTVVEKNMEYLIVEYWEEDLDDEDIPVLKIPVTGTSRTMTLDFDKAIEL